MQVFVDAITQSAELLFGGSPEIWVVIWTTFQVAVASTVAGTILGAPMGFIMGASRFRGQKLLIALMNTGMAVPPVVIGLLVLMLLSRQGPLGFLGLMYTVDAMAIAQTIIALPVIAGLTGAAVATVPYSLRLQARSLGASRLQEAVLTLKEARLGVVAAIATGFAAVIRGVGAVMMVGGNIEGKTRVLTTAIVQEARRGDFGLALALGIVLMSITFGLYALVSLYQHLAERNGQVR